MMQKNFIALALATALGASTLGGCATDPTTGLPTINPTALASIESDVQSATAAICNFVPTIASVAGVVASFAGVGSAVTVAQQAAQAICTAVEAAPTTAPKATIIRGQHMTVRRLLATPTVNGVAIQGYFLK